MKISGPIGRRGRAPTIAVNAARAGIQLRLLVASVVLSGAVGVGSAYITDQWSKSAVLVAATAIVLSAGLAIRWLMGSLDPFEPLVMFSLAWLVMFVIRPGAMVHDSVYIYDTGL